MNKFSFIKQLLENEKFNVSQKDRFLKLVSNELESSEEIDNNIIRDIQLIKEKIGFEKPKEQRDISPLDLTLFSGEIDEHGELIIYDDKNDEKEISNEEIKSEDIDIEEAKIKDLTNQNLKEYLNPKYLYDFL